MSDTPKDPAHSYIPEFNAWGLETTRFEPVDLYKEVYGSECYRCGDGMDTPKGFCSRHKVPAGQWDAWSRQKRTAYIRRARVYRLEDAQVELRRLRQLIPRLKADLQHRPNPKEE